MDKYNLSKIIIVNLWTPASLMIILYYLTGGDFWSGFAGSSRSDSNFHEMLTTSAIYVAGLSSIVTVFLSILYAVRYREERAVYLLFAGLSVITPFIAMITFLLAGALLLR